MECIIEGKNKRGITRLLEISRKKHGLYEHLWILQQQSAGWRMKVVA